MLSNAHASIEMEVKSEDRDAKQVAIEVKEAPEHKIVTNVTKIPSLLELAWNQFFEFFTQDEQFKNINSAFKLDMAKEEKEALTYIRDYARLLRAKKNFQLATLKAQRKKYLQSKTISATSLFSLFLIITVFASFPWHKYSSWDDRNMRQQTDLLFPNCVDLPERMYHSKAYVGSPIRPASDCGAYSRNTLITTLSQWNCSETVINYLYDLCEEMHRARNHDLPLILLSILFCVGGLPLFFAAVSILCCKIMSNGAPDQNKIVLEMLSPDTQATISEFFSAKITQDSCYPDFVEPNSIHTALDEELKVYEDKKLKFLPYALTLFGKASHIDAQKEQQKAPVNEAAKEHKEAPQNGVGTELGNSC